MPPVRMYWWVFAICVQMYLGFSLKFHRFKRRDCHDNLLCPANSILFTLNKVDYFRCLAECYITRGCVGVFVKDVGKMCWGCAECEPNPDDMTSEEGTQFWHSVDYVVFGTYGVARDQFSESSSKGSATQYRAYQANPRKGIRNYVSTWGSSKTNKNQYVQVDFRRNQTVTTIATQAHGHWRWPNRVAEYRVLYSDNCVDFEYVRGPPNGDPVLFPGNTNWWSTVFNDLPMPITSVCFRINPTKWVGGQIEMRFDMIGCAYVP